jgi:hypothetical protein
MYRVSRDLRQVVPGRFVLAAVLLRAAAFCLFIPDEARKFRLLYVTLPEIRPHYPFFFNVISGFRGAGGITFPKKLR